MSEQKRTLVIGASDNPTRYSYRAIEMLTNDGHDFVPMGVKKKTVKGKTILPPLAEVTEDIHTVTLYINPTLQKPYFNFITDLEPKRVIFNPGTENPKLYKLLQRHDIEVVNACTLVMISTGQY